MNKNLIHKVKDKSTDILKWQEIEEKTLHQKAKIEWIKLGNGNNQYFHATVKAKNNSKRLTRVCKADGTKLITSGDIK